jgi:poly(A) polymerase
MALSRERIADELRKLLSVSNPAGAVRAMLDARIFASFLPEVLPNAGDILTDLHDREATSGAAPSATRRLSAVLPADPVLVEKVAARLKLSNRMRADLVQLAAHRTTGQTARQLAYAIGPENARDIVFLSYVDDRWASELASLNGWSVPELPIKGGELIAKGLRAGPVVAKTLQAIEAQWVAESFPPEARLLEITDQLVAEALRSERKE